MLAEAVPRGARWRYRTRAVPHRPEGSGLIVLRHYFVDGAGRQHGPYATAEHARLAGWAHRG